MGFWRSFSESIAKKAVVDRAFNAGQKAEPPPSYSNSEAGKQLQRISDEAYEKGQKSVLVKIGNKIAK
jgi:hypothetical protein